MRCTTEEDCEAESGGSRTGGRTIVHVALSGEASAREASGRGKREKKPAKIAPGTIVTAKVTNVHATHAGVELETGAPTLFLP